MHGSKTYNHLHY